MALCLLHDHIWPGHLRQTLSSLPGQTRIPTFCWCGTLLNQCILTGIPKSILYSTKPTPSIPHSSRSLVTILQFSNWPHHQNEHSIVGITGTNHWSSLSMQIFEALQTRILKRASIIEMATFHLGWRLPGILMDLFKALKNRRGLKLIFNLMYSTKKFLQVFMIILHSVLSSQNQTNSPVHCSPLWAKKLNFSTTTPEAPGGATYHE